MPSAGSRKSFHRTAAVLLMASLVLGLGLLAKLPGVHTWLHVSSAVATRADDGHDRSACPDDASEAHADTSCAVSLFAQGLPTPELAPHPSPPRILATCKVASAPRSPAPRAASRLHPPAHAPPVSG